MKYLENKFDELDLRFIVSIQNKLQADYGDDALRVLLSSSFLERLEQESEYVYHYDENYWADIIKSEYESKNTLKSKTH